MARCIPAPRQEETPGVVDEAQHRRSEALTSTVLPSRIGHPADVTERSLRVCRTRRNFARCSPAALVLIGTLSALCGCRSEPPPGDTLRLVVQSPPEAIDPRFATSAVAVRLSHLVFAPLFEIGEDLTPAPLLAERLERKDDVTYEVTLREGARFHDGTPVTAEDVVYTYAGLNDADVRSPHAPKFKRLREVVALDARTVRFVLDEPFAAFPIELCALGVVSRRHCQGRSETCRDAPVGAGPFRVLRFDAAAEALSLAAHEGFVLGAPAIPKVEVRVVRDATTRLLELIDGKADLVVGDVAPTDLDVVARYEQLVAQKRPGLGYTYLAMNLRPPGDDDDEEEARTKRALSDARVRRAIALSVDVDAIVRTKLRDAARRASGMLPPGHWAKDASLAPLPYDPDEARRLLDAAGFEDRGPDGGGRFSLVLSTTTDRLRRSIALVLAHQLRAVGIDVRVRVGEWATLYEDIKRGSFEMFSAKWTPVVEPDLMHWVFHSSSVPGPNAAGGNRGAYKDPPLDGWIEEGRRLLDPEARKVPYQRAEARLLDTLPYVPLWFEDEIAVHQTSVQGFEMRRTGSFLPLARARLVRREAP